jgi:hypothetical protein
MVSQLAVIKDYQKENFPSREIRRSRIEVLIGPYLTAEITNTVVDCIQHHFH